jgi:SAM-dependent methyltransferase
MRLADFYKNTVAINDGGGGWAGYYYGVFTKIIADNNYTNVAEVGIGYGTHAKYILKNNPTVQRLYLIDPMVQYPNDGFSDDVMRQEPLVPGNNFNEFHDLIKQELLPFENRYTWFRVPSLAITNSQIKDGELDAVFVDGDHSYAAVRADLEFWWKKVRVGGQLLGDDYWMPDVARAVNDFANSLNIIYDLKTLPNNTYMIYRFHKTA